MSPENENLLVSKYPKIFKNINSDPTESSMYFGFEHGDGWFNIIDMMCSIIQSHIDYSAKQHQADIEFNQMIDDMKAGDFTTFDVKYNNNFILRERFLKDGKRKVREVVEQVVAEQVKEKLGTLRFYTSGGDEITYGIIRMAEAMSGVTCETCGSPGKLLNNKGWLYTSCKTHERKE